MSILDSTVFTLELNAVQLAAIYEYLYHTKLGSRNVYENEIANLMIMLDSKGIEDDIAEIKAEYGNFVIQATMNSDDGMTFEFLETCD
jgi:hypothetical protein